MKPTWHTTDETDLYPERRAVIVLWSKWPHLSFKPPPGGFNHKGRHQGGHCLRLYLPIIFPLSNHLLGHLDTNLSKCVQVNPNLGKPSVFAYVLMMIIVNVICGCQYDHHHPHHNDVQCFFELRANKHSSISGNDLFINPFANASPWWWCHNGGDENNDVDVVVSKYLLLPICSQN